MNIFNKIQFSLALSFTLLTPQVATAWSLPMDFDSGQKGGKVTEFSDAAGETFYTDERVHSGPQAAKLNIISGDDGFGTWGGRSYFNQEGHSSLGEGDNIYIRVSTFIPHDFSLSANPFLKFLRLHVNTQSGSHIGYVDIYIHSDGRYRYQNELATTRKILLDSESGSFRVGEKVRGKDSGATFIIEGIKDGETASYDSNYTGTGLTYKRGKINGQFNRWETVEGLTSGATARIYKPDVSNSVSDFGSNNPVTKGEWETVIYNVKFSSSNSASVKFWKHVGGTVTNGKRTGGNMKLIFQDDTDITLKSSSDVVDAFLLFTYWNGNAPKTQHMYIDDILISTEPPPELEGIVAAPNPPALH